MKRLIWIGVAGFLLALLIVLPARWVAGLLPAEVQCAAWSGSIWHGQCNGLVIQQKGAPIEAQLLQWKLHPAALLRLSVRTDFSFRTVQGTGSGVAELGRKGRVDLENLAIKAVFDRRLATMLAEGWTGQLQASDLTVKLQGNTLNLLSGEINLQDFNDGRGTTFGSYRLLFPRAAKAPFTGTLSDTGGPLAIKASITIAADRRWQLDGTVTPRPDAPESLTSRLEILGPPDATGGYRLLSEGTFK
jgi:hypothetical protein